MKSSCVPSANSNSREAIVASQGQLAMMLGVGYTTLTTLNTGLRAPAHGGAIALRHGQIAVRGMALALPRAAAAAAAAA